MTHHDHDHEPAREREVIVTDGGNRGGGAGAAIAAIIGVLVVLFLAWMLFGGGFGGEGDTTNIEAPAIPSEAELDVNVDEGGGEG